jgi:hypothetical protein
MRGTGQYPRRANQPGSDAALGPRGLDVGWCRLDLYLLYGERIADQFLDCYAAASRHLLPNPLLYDLWAVARSHQDVESWVPNYRDLGRGDLTAAELRCRHSAWTEYLLSTLSPSPHHRQNNAFRRL